MMVIEFARNVLGYKDANSAEMNPDTPHNVIDIMEEQKSITQMGGTMRLGAYECELAADSRVAEAYGKVKTIHERHRHRYEFNNKYKEEYESRDTGKALVHRCAVPSRILLNGAPSASVVHVVRSGVPR